MAEAWPKTDRSRPRHVRCYEWQVSFDHFPGSGSRGIVQEFHGAPGQSGDNDTRIILGDCEPDCIRGSRGTGGSVFSIRCPGGHPARRDCQCRSSRVEDNSRVSENRQSNRCLQRERDKRRGSSRGLVLQRSLRCGSRSCRCADISRNSDRDIALGKSSRDATAGIVRLGRSI